jgi:hypothetical protein
MGWESRSLSRIPESKKPSDLGFATLLGGVIPTDNGGASVLSERHHGIHQRLRSVGELFKLEHARRPAKVFFQMSAAFRFSEYDCYFNLSSQYSNANIYFLCPVADFVQIYNLSRNCFNL